MSDEHNSIVTVDATPIAAPRPSQSLHPVVEAMMAQDPSPDTLQALLRVQREWEADEARKAFARDLVALKAELPPVLARRSAGHTGRYASLDTIMREISPIISRHGFALSWSPATEGNDVAITCTLLHVAGHSTSCTVHAPPDTGPGRNPVQARGSTMTYLSRYSALLLLGLATGDAADADEPRAPDPSSVDPKRNLEVAAIVRKRGLSVEAAEEHVGRRVKAWTGADLARLRQWVSQQAREPGAEG